MQTARCSEPSNGFITDTNVNFGSLTTRGVDAKINYRQPLADLGSLLFNLEGTRLINLGNQPLTGRACVRLRRLLRHDLRSAECQVAPCVQHHLGDAVERI